MANMYYIGLDVHKKKISYCVKDMNGRICAEGAIAATRIELTVDENPPATVERSDGSHRRNSRFRYRRVRRRSRTS